MIGIRVKFYSTIPAVIFYSLPVSHYYYAMKMTQKTTTILALTTSCFIASTPANAYWTLDADTQGTRMFLIANEITQINAPSYFKISPDEIVTPSTITTEKVAIISGFSIDKIINVTPGQTLNVADDATIVSIPDELGVKYVEIGRAHV